MFALAVLRKLFVLSFSFGVCFAFGMVPVSLVPSGVADGWESERGIGEGRRIEGGVERWGVGSMGAVEEAGGVAWA